MPSKEQPFTVRNARPRRTVMLFGKVLASGIKGGKSEMDLTEEQFLDQPTQRLIALRRLDVVRAPVGWGSSPEPIPDLRVEPVEVEEPKRAHNTDGTFRADDPETDINESWEGGKSSGKWTLAELEETDRTSLRAIAKDLGVSAGGKNTEIIKRILAAQGEA